MPGRRNFWDLLSYCKQVENWAKWMRPRVSDIGQQAEQHCVLRRKETNEMRSTIASGLRVEAIPEPYVAKTRETKTEPSCLVGLWKE